MEAVILGGEALHHKHVATLKALNPHVRIYNEYGPTEITVACSAREIAGAAQPITIGTPIANTRMYVLNDHLKLVPVGVKGEICVAGEGVARGYLNKPAETQSKFIPNPFGSSPADRLYRTGDVGRWLPNGELEYLGRSDNQVKIRGNRLELGEVEAQLLRHPAVENAVVAVGGQDEDKHLVAYLVAAGKVSNKALRAFLATLPDYMIPSRFVCLEALPLTSNGKIDHEALALLEGSEESHEYAAPASDMERLLVEIFESVLGKRGVGVEDDFFALGGDSIKAVQIVSRLHKAGFKLEVRDVFEHVVLRDLALRVKTAVAVAEQAPVTGAVPLTPIQKQFFANPSGRHHYNQAVLLHLNAPVREPVVRAVFGKVQAHHDALRMVFEVEADGTVRQQNRDTDLPVALTAFDFSGAEDGALRLEAACRAIQAGMDLANGPLMQVALFHLKDGDRLLVAIHHLVVDGVSWRILLEDVETLLGQAEKGQRLELPPKTDSFKGWAEKLRAYADSAPLLREAAFWRALEENEAEPLYRDFDGADNSYRNRGRYSFSLDANLTEQLLTKPYRAYTIDMNVSLLAALARSIGRVWGQKRIAINLEGHGREEIIKDVNLSRTVGWFTSIYPVLLDCTAGSDFAAQLPGLKEQLKAIPFNGIGYGLLKYLTAAEQPGGSGFALQPEITFNYLGQFTTGGAGQGRFRPAAEKMGDVIGEDRVADGLVDVVGFVGPDRTLTVTFEYSRSHYEGATIETLAEQYKTAITDLVAHCAKISRRVLTPSDLSYPGLKAEELRSLQTAYQVEDVYGLSPMQEGMYFHNMMNNHTNDYFVQTSYKLRGNLDVACVEQSFNQLFSRHSILRTSFINDGAGRLLQVVEKERNITLVYEDISNSEEKEAFIREFKAQDRARLFDLSKDALMRLAILRLGEEEYEVIWTHHHILMDGWCGVILIKEFYELYFSHLENRPSRLLRSKPYAEYIKWVKEQDKAESKRFWQTYLKDYNQYLNLPKAAATTSHYDNQVASLALTPGQTKKLQELCARYNVTPSNFVETVWAVLLGRYNNAGDVVFGRVVSGRPAEIVGVEGMVGLFINTVPVRMKFGEKTRFIELVKKVQQEELDSRNYHYLPLAEIQSCSALKKDLVNHLFIFENYPLGEHIEGVVEDAGKNVRDALQVTDVEVFEQTNYDLNVIVHVGKSLVAKLNYNANVYDPVVMARVCQQFETMLARTIERADLEIAQVHALSAIQYDQVVYDFNDSAKPYPKDKTVHGLFDDCARANADCVALTYNSVHLTYRELNARSNQFAHYLREQYGIKPDDLVGIMVERSEKMIIALLGILKAGAAFVPIDPSYPIDRIKYIVEDASLKVLLVADLSFDVHSQLPDTAIDVVQPAENYQEYSPLSPADINTPRDLAYVIYTSGTTGRPKGVLVEHGGVVNMLVDKAEAIGLNKADTVLQFASLSFDVGLAEILMTFYGGARLVVIDKVILNRADEFIEFIRGEAITVMIVTPSFLAALDHDKLKFLRVIITGGESANATEVRYFSQFLDYFNAYGPTECSVYASMYKADPGAAFGSNVPIGKPMANAKIYVLDQNLDPQPIGVPGDIYLAGPGLARGYLNQDHLTREKFVRNPFIEGARMYKTGDLGKWRDDGNMEFLGRRDHQVKIRGYRIELGEIENTLLRNNHISDVYVKASPDKTGVTFLTAYYIPRVNLAPLEARAFLQGLLPNYMIPAFFVPVESFPLTVNGKVDAKELPNPLQLNSTTGLEFKEAETDAEILLRDFWQEILGLERISTYDNFFEIGGDSLKVIKMYHFINRLYPHVRISALYSNPTIAQQALLLKDPAVAFAEATPAVTEIEF
ncbi:MAG: amino acid adenylation domain-containing protein [Cytophagales bacterium]|nr:amino acid adenylation domain-containing protein [Cytophagales bacterium]